MEKIQPALFSANIWPIFKELESDDNKVWVGSSEMLDRSQDFMHSHLKQTLRQCIEAGRTANRRKMAKSSSSSVRSNPVRAC
jgi:hypothetical protein